jgi:hypothetical protein
MYRRPVQTKRCSKSIFDAGKHVCFRVRERQKPKEMPEGQAQGQPRRKAALHPSQGQEAQPTIRAAERGGPMRTPFGQQPAVYLSIKELISMKKRIALGAFVFATVIISLLPVATATAASPWWQVVTGSRPTHLWMPDNNVQALQAGPAATLVSIEGTTVACMYSPFCSFFGFPNTETAQQLEEALEGPAAYGPGNVEVVEEPAASRRFLITSVGEDAGRSVPPLTVVGTGSSAAVVTEGGSGRLVISLTNLGDAPVNGTAAPVTIVDELPDGVEATGVEAFAGVRGNAGPVNCNVEAGNLVSCVFEGILPSYEGIEVEILVSLTDDPPVAVAAGTVRVTGGGAAPTAADQVIRVSPEPVPFGFEHFSARAEEEGGGSSTDAGSHPFQLTTTVQLNAGRQIRLSPNPLSPPARPFVVEQPALPRNLRFPLPAGLVGNTRGMPQCSMATFFDIAEFVNACPDETAIGVSSTTIVERNALGLLRLTVPIFNLPPAPGEPARFGFVAAGVPIVIDTEVDPENRYRIIAKVSNVPQVSEFLSSTAVIWGTPGDPRHDSSRGWGCVYSLADLGPCERPPNLEEAAFLRQPVSCATPFDFEAELEPWNVPLGSVVKRAVFDAPEMSACGQVPFNPAVAATPTSRSAGGSSGLHFRLDMPNAGLLNPKATASEGQAKKVEVTLPEGVTINPSQAEDLGVCSPADYAREAAGSPLGAGCPESSKVGSVDITTPLLEEEAHGSVYVAAPYDNPFDSLLALYMVAKIPERGILVKQAGKVQLNPNTGQIVTTFDDLPQIPFDTFKLDFFAGNRAPLVMPPQCGTYEVVAKFTPWHASDPNNPLPSEIIERRTSFAVSQGHGGGACPSGPPLFAPDLDAGTVNPIAGTYSPLNIRLTREDGEGEFSRFSVKLPPGVIGKLAGVPFCSEAGIAAARARTGRQGGQEEITSPSCPPASQIGQTLVGAGVGPELSYAPGKVYLAGPYQGAKLSIVAITTAKVGPFDLGTVVIRQALRINPVTAEVTSDGSRSDPIPRILQGIVVHARDIRVHIDRDNFVLNPTNCERMTAAATVLSTGSQSATATAPFQAADCASLGFKPKLSLKLLGGTKRSEEPRLRAVLTARKGDANIGRAQVTLPPSAFLEQAHIRTICTRVQFNAGAGNGAQCPKASIYGRARAISPLLDEPLKGPVFLRSSNNELPDLVAALHSRKVDINLVGRIDSLNGRIRTTFSSPPDAPVRKFVLAMQGGQKGLIVNNTNICKGTHRAIANFKGHNGRKHLFNPVVKAQCGGKKGGKRK